MLGYFSQTRLSVDGSVQTELQFAGAEQWSFLMKTKNHLKDLTQLFGLIAAAIKAVVMFIDLLSKVVNYGGRVRELSVF
jgi:hypothetical protein